MSPAARIGVVALLRLRQRVERETIAWLAAPFLAGFVLVALGWTEKPTWVRWSFATALLALGSAIWLEHGRSAAADHLPASDAERRAGVGLAELVAMLTATPLVLGPFVAAMLAGGTATVGGLPGGAARLLVVVIALVAPVVSGRWGTPAGVLTRRMAALGVVHGVVAAAWIGIGPGAAAVATLLWTVVRDPTPQLAGAVRDPGWTPVVGPAGRRRHRAFAAAATVGLTLLVGAVTVAAQRVGLRSEDASPSEAGAWVAWFVGTSSLGLVVRVDAPFVWGRAIRDSYGEDLAGRLRHLPIDPVAAIDDRWRTWPWLSGVGTAAYLAYVAIVGGDRFPAIAFVLFGAFVAGMSWVMLATIGRDGVRTQALAAFGVTILVAEAIGGFGGRVGVVVGAMLGLGATAAAWWAARRWWSR